MIAKLDLINGLLEFGSGIFMIPNIIRIAKDKEIKGVTTIPTVYFTAWGLFNVTAFYSGMNLPLSVIGGFTVTIANVIWLSMVYYFKYKNKLKT